MKVGAIYRVEWEDSCSIDGGGSWKDSERVAHMTPSRVVTVGRVAAIGKRNITLVASWDEDDHVAGEMCIPLSCVRRKKRLA